MRTLLHALKLVPMQFPVQDRVASRAARSFYLLLILLSMKRYLSSELRDDSFSSLTIHFMFHAKLWHAAMLQFLEVVRIEGHAFSPEDVTLARDMYLLQVMCPNILFAYFI